VKIRNKFGPVNIGDTTFPSRPLSLNLSVEYEEERRLSSPRIPSIPQEEEEHDLLSSANSEGNFSFYS